MTDQCNHVYCPLITLTLTIISVRCIPLNLRSKTWRRATLLIPTWIYSCQSVGTDGQLHTSLYDKHDDSNFNITNFPFLSSSIPSSLAYGVFISQLIRYARARSSYECFILRAVRLSNKLLGQGYVKERLRSSLRKIYGRYGDLIKQYEAPSPECYTTFWMMTIYSDTRHWSGTTPIFDPITDLISTLLPNLTFYLIARGFQRTFATDAACQQRTLTPPETWSCPTLGLASVLCWHQSLLNLSCFRTFEFRTSLGTFVLLFLLYDKDCCLDVYTYIIYVLNVIIQFFVFGPIRELHVQ